MIPAAILSIVFSVLQIVVPEVDAIAARHLKEGQCYVLTFNRAKTAAVMRPSSICHDEKQLAVKGYQLARNGQSQPR